MAKLKKLTKGKVYRVKIKKPKSHKAKKGFGSITKEAKNAINRRRKAMKEAMKG